MSDVCQSSFLHVADPPPYLPYLNTQHTVVGATTFTLKNNLHSYYL